MYFWINKTWSNRCNAISKVLLCNYFIYFILLRIWQKRMFYAHAICFLIKCVIRYMHCREYNIISRGKQGVSFSKKKLMQFWHYQHLALIVTDCTWRSYLPLIVHFLLFTMKWILFLFGRNEKMVVKFSLLWLDFIL